MLSDVLEQAKAVCPYGLKANPTEYLAWITKYVKDAETYELAASKLNAVRKDLESKIYEVNRNIVALQKTCPHYYMHGRCVRCTCEKRSYGEEYDG